MTATPMASNVSVRAALDALLAKLNVASTGGTIKVYTGTQGATTLATVSGTLLGTLTFPTTAFANSSNDGLGDAVATANTIAPDTSIDNTGTAGHFRALDSAGTVILMGNINTSSADMIVSTTSLVAGGQLSISSYTVTLPSGAASS